MWIRVGTDNIIVPGLWAQHLFGTAHPWVFSLKFSAKIQQQFRFNWECRGRRLSAYHIGIKFLLYYRKLSNSETSNFSSVAHSSHSQKRRKPQRTKKEAREEEAKGVISKVRSSDSQGILCGVFLTFFSKENQRCCSSFFQQNFYRSHAKCPPSRRFYWNSTVIIFWLLFFIHHFAFDFYPQQQWTKSKSSHHKIPEVKKSVC